MLTPVVKTIKLISSVLLLVLDLFKLLYLSIKSNIFHRGLGGRDIFRDITMQIYFTGVQAFPIIFIVATLVGMIVVIQSATQLSRIGAGESLGNILVLVIIRELGPIITAILLIARSATAITTEIGNMKVFKEVQALEVIGVNTLQFIVFPRLFGGVIAMMCLSVYFVFVAILGGYILANTMLSIPLNYYLENIIYSITPADMIIFFTKNLILALTIFLIACYFGLSVQGAVFEVPVMVIKTVVASLFLCISVNAVMSLAFYLFWSKSALIETFL